MALAYTLNKMNVYILSQGWFAPNIVLSPELEWSSSKFKKKFLKFIQGVLEGVPGHLRGSVYI
jgi:hypothetical protein